MKMTIAKDADEFILLHIGQSMATLLQYRRFSAPPLGAVLGTTFLRVDCTELSDVCLLRSFKIAVKLRHFKMGVVPRHLDDIY